MESIALLGAIWLVVSYVRRRRRFRASTWSPDSNDVPSSVQDVIDAYKEEASALPPILTEDPLDSGKVPEACKPQRYSMSGCSNCTLTELASMLGANSIDHPGPGLWAMGIGTSCMPVMTYGTMKQDVQKMTLDTAAALGYPNVQVVAMGLRSTAAEGDIKSTLRAQFCDTKPIPNMATCKKDRTPCSLAQLVHYEGLGSGSENRTIGTQWTLVVDEDCNHTMRYASKDGDRNRSREEAVKASLAAGGINPWVVAFGEVEWTVPRLAGGSSYIDPNTNPNTYAGSTIGYT